MNQPSTAMTVTTAVASRTRTLPRSASVRAATPARLSHWRHDLGSLLSSLPERDQSLVAWVVKPDGFHAAAHTSAVGLAPQARASATASASRRLRVNLRQRFPDLHTDVATLAHQLGTIVPLEVGRQLIRDTFGDLPQLHYDLLLWLAGDYREERDCLGKHGTKVFDDACAELADEHGVLPNDLANALLRHQCWSHAHVPALERSPHVCRVGDRWVYLGKTTVDRVVAVLAALARPATLTEVRTHLGPTRLPEAALAADPRLVRVGPREFAVRPLRSGDVRAA